MKTNTRPQPPLTLKPLPAHLHSQRARRDRPTTEGTRDKVQGTRGSSRFVLPAVSFASLCKHTALIPVQQPIAYLGSVFNDAPQVAVVPAAPTREATALAYYRATALERATLAVVDGLAAFHRKLGTRQGHTHRVTVAVTGQGVHVADIA